MPWNHLIICHSLYTIDANMFPPLFSKNQIDQNTFVPIFINDPDCLLSKGLNEVPRGNRRVILQSTRIFDFKEQFCVGTSFSFWDQTGECKNKCHFKVTFVHDHFRICKIVTRKGNSPKTSSLGNFHSVGWRFQFFTWCFLKRHLRNEAVETAWKAKQVVKKRQLLLRL